jgi:hypothetical protein
LQKQITPTVTMAEVQKQIQSLTVGAKVPVPPPTFKGATTLPKDLQFLIPSTASNVTVVEAQFGSSDSGYNVNYVLGGDVSNNYNIFFNPPSAWKAVTRKYSGSAALTELSGASYNISIQMSGLASTTTNTVIEIIKK